MLVDETGGGKNGNYAIAKTGLSELDFSKGVTVSLKVRPTANSSDFNYLFAIGKTKGFDSFAYCDGTIGFIARYGDQYAGHFPNEGWVEGNPVDSKYNYFSTAGENDPSAVVDKWYRMTFVYSPDETCIYVDGKLTCRWASASQLIRHHQERKTCRPRSKRSKISITWST